MHFGKARTILNNNHEDPDRWTKLYVMECKTINKKKRNINKTFYF